MNTQKFDLVFIYGKDGQLKKLMSLLQITGSLLLKRTESQFYVLHKISPKNRPVHSISLFKNGFIAHFHWQGGIRIFLANPAMKQPLWWWKERVVTKLKYQYLGRFLGE